MFSTGCVTDFQESIALCRFLGCRFQGNNAKKVTEADMNSFPSKDIPSKLQQDPYRS